ncbi:MAG: FAD-binding domain-containing protein, partial [Gemmobacter sp.]|nr:FAD-binding domain-containing protein [Gemmobacter sp.]
RPGFAGHEIADPEAADDDRPLAAWLAGETGLPYLDACMRYLRATGWLDAPSRAMAVGCATALLGISPQAAGQALARRCTDYDPALHWPQVLAARPVHPLRLGLRLDPGGSFTRRWLPELAPVPEPFLHMPWRWEGARHLLGRRYPEPLVGLPPTLRQRSPRRPPCPGSAPQHQLCLDL